MVKLDEQTEFQFHSYKLLYLVIHDTFIICLLFMEPKFIFI